MSKLELPKPKKLKSETKHAQARLEKEFWNKVNEARKKSGYTWEQVFEFGFSAFLEAVNNKTNQ